MDDMRLKFLTPVVTGTPGVSGRVTTTGRPNGQQGPSFEDVLSEQLAKTGGVEFSKHAIKRVAEHNMTLDAQQLERLNKGVQMAGEKNLDDTLILVGSAAFLVNVRNNTVITAVESGSIQGNVFTNIDGAVIV